MELIFAIMIGVMFACGLYGMLSGQLFRFFCGVVLMSNAINMIVFTSNTMIHGEPALWEKSKPLDLYTDPLPQALVLTAIVIGLGIVGFVILLLLRAYRILGVSELEELPGDKDDEG